MGDDAETTRSFRETRNDAEARGGSLDHAILRTREDKDGAASADPVRRRVRFRDAGGPRVIGPVLAALLCWAAYATVGMTSKQSQLSEQQRSFVFAQNAYLDRVEDYQASIEDLAELCRDYGCPERLINSAVSQTDVTGPVRDSLSVTIDEALRRLAEEAEARAILDATLPPTEDTDPAE
ncbi:MAG: hypothetical protein AAGL49_04815 [Pseudomonadota bacterium]